MQNKILLNDLLYCKNALKNRAQDRAADLKIDRLQFSLGQRQVPEVPDNLP